MKARSGVGNFFLVAGFGFVVAGIIAVSAGGLGGGIAGLTFLMIGGIWMLVAIGLRFFYGGMARKAQDEQKLFETGKRATAVIDSVETGSVVLNNINQQVFIRLRVQPRDEPEFVLERKMFVPFHGMPRTGDLIEVAYDAADHSKFALETDWRSDTAGGRLLVLRRPGEQPLPAGMQAGAVTSGAPAPAPAAEAPPSSRKTAPERVIEQLERLDRLRDQGVLTDTEFEVQKAKVLSGQDV